MLSPTRVVPSQELSKLALLLLLLVVVCAWPLRKLLTLLCWHTCIGFEVKVMGRTLLYVTTAAWMDESI
jgi:hypothetical protein